MSNHIISEVYKRRVGNLARTAVMVLLADKASDDGSGIWASKQRMAEEIGASKQTVIATIKLLKSDGLLRECGQRPCANGHTVEYAIDLRALRSLPLVRSHDLDRSENLTGQDGTPVSQTDSTGQAASPHPSENLTPPVKEVDPNPPRTLLEPSLNRNEIRSATAPRRRSSPELTKPGDVSDQVWADFLAHRKRKRADLSSTALNSIRSQASAAGWSLEGALIEMIARGWTGFKAEWVRADSTQTRRSDPPSTKEIGLEVVLRRRAARIGRGQQGTLIEHHDGKDISAGMASMIGSAVK